LEYRLLEITIAYNKENDKIVNRVSFRVLQPALPQEQIIKSSVRFFVILDVCTISGLFILE